VYTPFLDSGQLNYLNPASYATMSRGNTLFSVGIGQRISFYKQGEASDIRPNGNLNHIALGFRLKKHFGMAFGLKPLSASGYYLSESTFTGLDSIRNTYQGSGYINQVFLGGTYAPIHIKGTYLGFGANFGYNFGSIKNQRISQLIQGTNASGGLMEELMAVNDISFELGTAFYQQLGQKVDVTLGATWKPNQSLNSTYERAFFSANNLNSPSTYDTLFTDAYRGTVNQGQALAAGFSLRMFLNPYKRKTKTLHPELVIAGQFSSTEHNTYAYEGYTYDSLAQQLTNANRYGFGISFRPERFLYENIATLGFFDKFTYRIGGYVGQLPYVDQAKNSFREQGITLGLGIPILAQQSFSSINFSCTLGQRGTFVTNGLQENFVAFQLNAILSPASFERWFRKRKMD